jgi:hypothetical protein
VNKLQVAILAGALAVAGSASAQITLTLDEVGQVGNGNYETVTLQSSALGINESGVEAGVYNLTVNGVATPSFCVDIVTDEHEGLPPYTDYSYAPLSSAPITAAGPMGASGAAAIEKLWAAYYSPTISQVNAAALQVAIWEEIALSKGTYTLTVSGYSDPAVSSEVTTMLDALNAGDLTTEADLIALVSPTGQGYVVAVPETTTVIAGALLLLPFGVTTLRILRKTRKP